MSDDTKELLKKLLSTMQEIEEREDDGWDAWVALKEVLQSGQPEFKTIPMCKKCEELQYSLYDRKFLELYGSCSDCLYDSLGEKEWEDKANTALLASVEALETITYLKSLDK